MTTTNDMTPEAKSRLSVLTTAVAKSLAVSAIKQLNQSSIKNDIVSDTTHNDSINSMVNAHMHETILNNA